MRSQTLVSAHRTDCLLHGLLVTSDNNDLVCARSQVLMEVLEQVFKVQGHFVGFKPVIA